MPRISQAVAAGLVCLTLAGCQAEEPPPPQPSRPVATIAVEPTPSAESVTLTGSIAAQVESNLSFRTSGQIVEISADVGDRVRAGQLLARIDTSVQQADVESAKAGTASAEADVEQATAAFERARSLFDRGYTTRREFDAADRALTVARADADAARARLESAEDSLSFTNLTAEADGIVTARELDVGELAQAAATVFTLALDGPRDAVFDIYESLLLQAAEPPQVTVALAADPSVSVPGRIRQISPTVDRQSGTVRIKVGLAQTPDQMTLGAAVVGTAELPSEGLVVVPASAMTSLDASPAVWVLDPRSGEVRPRRITVSSYQASSVTVREGLDVGDLVVVTGTKLLRPGEAIETVAEEAESR